MAGREPFPASDRPEPIGGDVSLAGSYRRVWGTFEWTEAASARYSIVPGRLPGTQEELAAIPPTDKRWSPEVSIRLVSWEEAGIVEAKRDKATTLTSQVGLHPRGATVGICFHTDRSDAMHSELESSGGGSATNPMVRYLAETAAWHAGLGVEQWCNGAREKELKLVRKMAGAVGMIGVGICLVVGNAAKQPVTGDMAAGIWALADIGVIGYLQTMHEHSLTVMRRSNQDLAGVYSNMIARDIQDIFTPRTNPPPE